MEDRKVLNVLLKRILQDSILDYKTEFLSLLVDCGYLCIYQKLKDPADTQSARDTQKYALKRLF